nr:restriction endonuclease subunit S [Oscillochloris sp. ZM17-4]
MLATKFRFTPKHVLYGKLRPYLNKVLLPSFDGVCTTEILPILPNERKLDRAYLWAYLLSPEFVSWASESVSGANLPRIDPKLLADHPIPLPPLAEQRRIAAVLARADRPRRLRRYALELSAGYLQAVFVEMFGEPFTNPKNWSDVSLGDALALEPHIGTIEPAQDTGLQRCIRVGELGSWFVELEKCQFVSLQGRELRRFQALPGDILLARAIASEDHLGKLSLVPQILEDVIFDSHVMRLRTDSSRLINLYLATFLRTDGGRARFMRQARRTAVQFNVNAEQISGLQVPLPPLALQERFAAIARRHERLRGQQREALRQAEQLFDALLGQAFRGELGEAAGAIESLAVRM